MLSDAALIRETWFFVNLCHIHLSPRKQLHPFIWTNQFFFLATSQLTESLHVLSCSTDASQHQYQSTICALLYFKGTCRLKSRCRLPSIHSIYLIIGSGYCIKVNQLLSPALATLQQLRQKQKPDSQSPSDCVMWNWTAKRSLK